jgi:hypothetical protein
MREALNNGVVQQLGDILRETDIGDLLSLLLAATAPTEAAAAVASNAKTLANAASLLFDVVATAGGVTGRKTILIGDSTVIPQGGQIVWDGPGSTSVRFAAADAVTAADFRYIRQDGVGRVVGILERRLGQQDRNAT